MGILKHIQFPDESYGLERGLNNAKLTNHARNRARKRLVEKLVSSDVQCTNIIPITDHRNAQIINNYSCLSESKLKNIIPDMFCHI